MPKRSSEGDKGEEHAFWMAVAVRQEVHRPCLWSGAGPRACPGSGGVLACAGSEYEGSLRHSSPVRSFLVGSSI